MLTLLKLFRLFRLPLLAIISRFRTGTITTQSTKSKKTPVALLGIVATIAVSIGGYYLWSESKIKVYETQIRAMSVITKQYESAITEQKKSIDELIESNRIIEIEKSKLNMELLDASNTIYDLQTLLREHDLEVLSERKPKLIEKRINDATRSVFDDFESITSDWLSETSK